MEWSRSTFQLYTAVQLSYGNWKGWCHVRMTPLVLLLTFNNSYLTGSNLVKYAYHFQHAWQRWVALVSDQLLREIWQNPSVFALSAPTSNSVVWKSSLFSLLSDLWTNLSEAERIVQYIHGVLLLAMCHTCYLYWLDCMNTGNIVQFLIVITIEAVMSPEQITFRGQHMLLYQ